jgi:two-component system chemotaxis response regulator CheB
VASQGRNIVVVGASAGGLQALEQLVSLLPADLPASVFVVQHLAPENSGVALLERLSTHALACKVAADGEAFRRNTIYIAPADHHLLVKPRTLLVTKGARENRFRPAIDPLFRSAAVAHGPRAIGVVLTGYLDDGTAGMEAIHQCGGTTIVQDPAEAAYPDMPNNVLRHMAVDHCVPLKGIATLVDRLTRERAGPRRAVPEDLRSESTIAERVLSDVQRVDGLGDQVPFNCPNCGGVLWQVVESDTKRFRCHVGHSYTARALLTAQSEKIEETLWVSLRMFEERRNLLRGMTERQRTPAAERSWRERIREAEKHIERLKDMLRSTTTQA